MSRLPWLSCDLNSKRPGDRRVQDTSGWSLGYPVVVDAGMGMPGRHVRLPRLFGTGIGASRHSGNFYMRYRRLAITLSMLNSASYCAVKSWFLPETRTCKIQLETSQDNRSIQDLRWVEPKYRRRLTSWPELFTAQATARYSAPHLQPASIL